MYKRQSDNWRLAFGKLKAKITRENSTSANKIKTIERSQFVNQTVPGKTGGAILTIDDLAGFTVDVGGFTGAVDDDWELPQFTGSYGLFGRDRGAFRLFLHRVR